MLEPPPAGMVDGFSVKELTLAGSWTPPGLSVTVPTEEPPVTAEKGFNVTDDKANGLAVTVSRLVTGTWP